MPLYEYECEKCGGIFEVMQKFSEEPLTTHEKCGGAVHRLLSAPALQFKGSGWYVNDYGKGGKLPEGHTSKKAESGKGESRKGESGKSESGGTSSGSDSGASSTPAATSSSSESKSSSSSDTK